jgi:hypothetical protein
MEWDAPARELMEKIPQEVQAMAVAGIEEFAKERGYKKITAGVVNEFKEEAGMNNK